MTQANGAAGHSPANVLIIGATSAIATAVARACALRGDRLYLMARSTPRLDASAADLRVRGAAEVHTAPFDAQDMGAIDAQIATAFETLGKVDLALVAHGTLPSQSQCEDDTQALLEAIQINGTATVALLNRIASHLASQGSGTLAAITSVAGDRGRKSNHAYGAAKAMVSVFLQGLRNRLFASGVQVLDVRPGFVDTPMTAGFDKSGPLWAQPSTIAADLLRAVDRGSHTLYTPWFWAWIMRIIRGIPEFLFKRLNL